MGIRINFCAPENSLTDEHYLQPIIDWLVTIIDVCVLKSEE